MDDEFRAVLRRHPVWRVRVGILDVATGWRLDGEVTAMLVAAGNAFGCSAAHFVHETEGRTP